MLGFRIHEETLNAIGDNAADVATVAAERVFQELSKAMAAEHPSVCWQLLASTRLLDHLVPELARIRDAEKTHPSLEGLFSHLTATCDCVPAAPIALRWAALLHDAGKPDTLASDERGIHFHGHDALSARIAKEVLVRLRAPNVLVKRVEHLVAHHMFSLDASSSDRVLRRFLSRVGTDAALDLITLRRADICGKTGSPPTYSDLARIEDRVRTMVDEPPAVTVRDLAIDGRGLMDEVGIAPGPIVGILLSQLLETVIDDPSMNTRESLVGIAKRFYDERLSVDDGASHGE